MARSIKKVTPKKRGRPATGKDPLVSTRMSVGLIGEIDGWADRSEIKRSEAIRRLVELGLKAKNDQLATCRFGHSCSRCRGRLHRLRRFAGPPTASRSRSTIAACLAQGDRS